MTIKTTKEALAPAMKKLAKIAGKKSTIPVLNHVAVSFDGSTLTLTANDRQCTYSVRLEATGEPQQYTLEAAKLATAVNAMRAGDIELSEGQVKQGRSRIKLATLPYGDFPQPDYESAESIGINGQSLSAALSFVRHASAVSDVRFYLNGVALDQGHAIATDGHRMAYTPPEGLDAPRSIIIPVAGVDQIIGMDGDVLLSESQLMIENETERYTTQLVEGKFPDWKRVIPQHNDKLVHANANDALEALNLAATGGGLNATLTFSNGACTISADGSESAFDVEITGADSVTIGCCMRYLIDAIRASGQENLQIALNDASSAMIINGDQVVMPVRL